MGAKQTKIEGSYLPDTPVTKCKTFKTIDEAGNVGTEMDPRSPAGCRTPIFISTEPNVLNIQICCSDMPEQHRNNEKSIDVLRKRFLKSFSYNLNDPRSPSLNLNRTPMVFEDSFEKPLSLDDTFSNLFVESKTLNKVAKSEEVINERQDDDTDQKENMIIDLEETSIEQHVPIALQQSIDPRSPSIGVERTPIIFTDDEIDEKNEDIMLESILASLSLDMNSSSNSSIASKKSENESVTFKNTNVQVIPVNKHLDGVRTGRKTASKLKNNKAKRHNLHRKIYEDENNLQMTPIFKTRQDDKKTHLKGARTPLSCVRNRNDTPIRSRSVESSVKSIKTRLALTSFDDTMNPTTEKYPVHKLHIMQQDFQDTPELNY